jgi:hypothetical protein
LALRKSDLLLRSSVLVGVLSALLALLWQFVNVHCLWDENRTALFVHGKYFPVPPELARENIHLFDNWGYDGQFCHCIAHDPLRRSSISRYVDIPNVRYQRILVPGLAYLLVGGQQALIDLAYYVVILLSVFAGSFWLSRYASRHDRHPAWGLTFVLVPSVLVSLERMTGEVALAALTVGFALYATNVPSWKLYLILVGAAFTRESGLMLVAAYCLYCLWRLKFVRCLIF